MRFSQMRKPRQTLEAEDLAAFAPGGAIVTIESYQYKTLEARRPGDAEIAHYLKVREFIKPFKLNDTSIGALTSLLGTDDTDATIGRTIKLFASKIWINDRESRTRKQIWTFDIDMIVPASPPTIAPNTDITRYAAQIGSGGGAGVLPTPVQPPALGTAMTSGAEASSIGIDLAGTIVATLIERGQTVETFVAYMGTIGAAQFVAGKLPPDWSKTALAGARAFSLQFPKSRPPLTDVEVARIRDAWRPPSEVIDRKTGEVVGAPAMPPEDDIPF